MSSDQKPTPPSATNPSAAAPSPTNPTNPTPHGPHQRPRVFDPYNKNPYPHQPPTNASSSPFYFRLPRLTPQQLALINKYSGYGWAALIIAGGAGALMGMWINRRCEIRFLTVTMDLLVAGYESKVIQGNGKVKQH
ncbi:hypothetical protein BCR44DRAFT_329680 [Catenaria anguillulae PL171]|uniref:Uncharacterized protein n=1 Tax=Catenaria anguillulae PL171 TaxID=765915 RepID=A0A1Y2I5R2_9FUNG|nr:hypothetical protein BCR44DRAFT_329680 [Catenaria anguillulae PL171]